MPSIEFAVRDALATWLGSQLAGVTVWKQWPDGAKLPPRALSVLLAGKPESASLQPTIVGQDVIHTGLTPKITIDPCFDLATAVLLLNTCRASYEAHRVDLDVHASADTTHVVTTPECFDLSSAILLANEMRLDLPAHRDDTSAHPYLDAKSTIALGDAFDLGSLVALVNQIRQFLNAHYPARIFHWEFTERSQPMQLDVWTQYEAARDEVKAALEPALNIDARAGADQRDPVREGLLLDLGNGWTGTVDFDFREPQDTDTRDASGRNEWRASYRGSASYKVVIKAQSARIARLIFRHTDSELDPAPWGIAAGSVTVTESTETYT